MPPRLRTAQSEQAGDRIVGIELLRFASAVAVLVFHYQHFSFIGPTPTLVTEAQPFFRPLQLFYEDGFYGVQVFWCISGFIFFWKYGRAIAERSISARAFLVLRVSRLYPLHLLTLVFVATLQPIYAARMHADFVYRYNDLYHFVLQLFMASNWGLEAGDSFNGPIWSISVELLVYVIFFVILRLISASWITFGAIVLGSGLAQVFKLSNSPIVYCLTYFFLGCLAALAFARTRQSARLARMASAGAFLAIISVLLLNLYIPVKPKWLLAVLSPAVIFLCVSHVRATPLSNRLLVPAGNMTYSSYLLHVPLQLTVMTFCAYTGFLVPFYRPYFFVCYIVVTLVLSSLCYKYFEMPAQRWLRRRFMPRMSTADKT